MLQRVMKLSLRARNEPHCFHWPVSLALCNQHFPQFLYVTVESRNLSPQFLRSVMGGGGLGEFGGHCLGFMVQYLLLSLLTPITNIYRKDTIIPVYQDRLYNLWGPVQHENMSLKFKMLRLQQLSIKLGADTIWHKVQGPMAQAACSVV